MDSRQPMSVGHDGTNSDNNNSSIRPPDKLNIDLSDLIDDLVGLANADAAINPADAGSSVLFSNLSQRITSLRSSIQEAKELCRPTPRVQRPGSAAPSSTISTPRPTTSTGAKGTPVPSVHPDPSSPFGLFQSACELDPLSQQKLLTAVAVSCVAKRNLLAELNQKLFDLKMQNDHFTI
ncbi:unnamed protein product [Hymenolepis diminuta]|uniref:Uncharacterized protein n=1 Tax=Hymenolepis diminuta TaxID=6216 RepID=A0A564YL96_HYMDI|nr:unnamed protein product [Hymenolepis diminuta]